jgi:hypothetical protein
MAAAKTGSSAGVTLSVAEVSKEEWFDSSSASVSGPVHFRVKVRD